MSLRDAVAALALCALCAAIGVRAASSVAPHDAGSLPAAAADVDCLPQAPAPTQAEMMDGMRRAVDHGLLWKATKDGRTAYLYGTIHVAQLPWMYPGPQVMHAVSESDLIALELDLTSPDILARLRNAVAPRPDAPALPEALQRRLAARMAADCIAPGTFAAMRPEMQVVTVQLLEGQRVDLYAAYGIDMVMAGLGRGLKKTIRSLETPESQASLLVSDDPAETAATVGQVLDELEAGKGPQQLQRLAGDWQRGDLGDLSAYASWCDCLDTAQQRADFVKLVDERNPLMADKIVQWHADGKSLFVAVGALHMIGPAGLPALLKARGFEVERVPFAVAH
jgi:uncharacterized protein YbaP (TraB family)